MFNKVLLYLEHVRVYKSVHVKNVSFVLYVLIYCCKKCISPTDLIRCDGFTSLRTGNASDGYERQLRTGNEYTTILLFFHASLRYMARQSITYDKTSGLFL